MAALGWPRLPSLSRSPGSFPLALYRSGRSGSARFRLPGLARVQRASRHGENIPGRHGAQPAQARRWVISAPSAAAAPAPARACRASGTGLEGRQHPQERSPCSCPPAPGASKAAWSMGRGRGRILSSFSCRAACSPVLLPRPRAQACPPPAPFRCTVLSDGGTKSWQPHGFLVRLGCGCLHMGEIAQFWASLGRLGSVAWIKRATGSPG